MMKTCEPGRRWVLLALIGVLVVAWGLRMRGIEWPLLHPDEYKIASWSRWIEEHSRTMIPGYPGGFFHLVKPILVIKNIVLEGVTAWQAFLGHGDTVVPPLLDQTFLLRKINVGFSLLTVLVFYGLAFRATASRIGALAAAAFLSLSVLHVTHSHYAETDIVMLFTLSFALYGWIRVSAEGRLWWICGAALLTGLAIGTKYTNLLLLPVSVVGLVMGLRAWKKERKGPKGSVFVLCAILLMVAGWLYTNRHVWDGAGYWKNLQSAGHSVYGERAGLLGQAVGAPHAALISNWNVLVENLTPISVLWLAFLVLGALVSVRTRYRWCWVVTWLPMLLYLFYFLAVAPWVRGQECLVFFPFAAMFIAMGVAESFRWAGSVKYRAGAISGLAAMLLIACVESGISALRFSNLCVMPDARVQATRWLYTHAPLQEVVGTEDYTIPACRLFGNAISVPQIEWMSRKQCEQSKMAYLLRNVSSTGRGSTDPRTHTLYLNYAENLAGFKSQSYRLCHWGVGGLPFSFVENEIEWWDARPVAPSLILESPLFRPVLTGKHSIWAIPMTESGVGSGVGLSVQPQGQDLVVGGENKGRRTIYVILQAEECAVDIIVNGMGDRHSVHLDPYEVAVVTVRRPWFMPHISEYDVVSVRDMPKKGFQSLSCHAQLAMDAREVAMILFQKGYADHALTWLSSVPAGSGSAWLHYVAAVEQDDWGQAACWERAARQCLEQFEMARALPPEQLLLNGCSGAAWQDHSRIRLPEAGTGENGVSFTLSPLSIELKTGEVGTNIFYGSLDLPVRLAPGVYSVRAVLTVPVISRSSGSWAITVGDSIGNTRDPLLVVAGVTCKVERQIKVNREQNVVLNFASDQKGGRFELSELEIRWNESTLFWAERRELYKALIRQAWWRGEVDVAHSLLAKARESIRDDEGWNRLEKAGDRVKADCQEAGGLFYPWVKILDATPVAPNRCRIRFETLKDDPPPLRLCAYRKTFVGACKIFEGPLALHKLAKGDVFALDIPLPEKRRVSEVGLQVTAGAQWVIGKLHVEGGRKGRYWVPLQVR